MTIVSKPPSWKEAGDKLKAAVAEETGKEITTEKAQGVQVSKNVAAFFKANAEVGSKNLGEGGAFFPYLKIGEANSKNSLADGTFAKPGEFYYAPTKEQMGDEITVSILNISDSFYLKSEPKEPTDDKRKHRKFVQLVGGVIVANNAPFVMIISGTRLNGLWQYGKDIKQYTKSKTDPIPMFALKIRMKLKLQDSHWGMNYVIEYAVAKDAAGFPQILQDEGNLQFLLDLSNTMGEQFKEYRTKFAVDPDTLQLLSGGIIPVEEMPKVKETTPGATAVLEATEEVVELPWE